MPTKTSWCSTKNCFTSKKADVAHKSVSCRQKQDDAAQKNYFVLKRVLIFFKNGVPYYHVMYPWSFLTQLGYLDLICPSYMCCRSLTSFNCFFKPIKISWSNFYQLHVLMFTLRTHDIIIFGGMNGKLASKNFFWK